MAKLHEAFAVRHRPVRLSGAISGRCSPSSVTNNAMCWSMWCGWGGAGTLVWRRAAKRNSSLALALLGDPDALLICNGYKDTRYLETAILARRLGRRPLVVIEQPNEVDGLMACSRQLGMAPLMGVRAKLSAQGTGRWGSSSGDGRQVRALCSGFTGYCQRPAGRGTAGGVAASPCAYRQPDQRYCGAQRGSPGDGAALCAVGGPGGAHGLSGRGGRIGGGL